MWMCESKAGGVPPGGRGGGSLVVGVYYISIYISIYTIYTYTRYIVYKRCGLSLGENFL